MQGHSAHQILPKTLGSQAARLVTGLHDRRRPIFLLGDVRDITGASPKASRNLAASLVRHGVATRLKPGLFVLVPFELGSERHYMGNPYVIARELMQGEEYYLSHASAMDLHGMTTQPQLVVFTTSTTSHRRLTVLGTEFRFVRCQRKHFFGTADLWVDKTERVTASDIERTLIDGLRQPEYCGGLSEVARGFWMKRHQVDIQTLVSYALRLDIGAVISRLGFLLENYGVSAPFEIEQLHSRLTNTYHLLDPTLPKEGRYFSRWRLQLNVTSEELLALTST